MEWIIVLVKGQVISWFRINEMFRFEDPYMYLVKRLHHRAGDGKFGQFKRCERY